MNTITELLNLEDSDIYVSNIQIIDTKKIITVETPVSIHFCPQCGFKMHSRGIRERTINHPVLQDGFECIIKLRQRRWRCTNAQCGYTVNEAFHIVNKRKRNTNATDMLVINAFRDLSASATSIAERIACGWSPVGAYSECNLNPCVILSMKIISKVHSKKDVYYFFIGSFSFF